MLAEDEDIAAVRAADGRGPLWWAHEAKNEEAMEMLKAAGADENWQDADGKTCKDFTHGQATEYMVRVAVCPCRFLFCEHQAYVAICHFRVTSVRLQVGFLS